VIFTSGTPPTVAAKRATSEIPIVFAPAGDPLASGLVASLARPGGNITGVSNQTANIASKRVDLLCELAGQVRRLAIMAKSSDNASAASEMREVKAAAGTRGIAAWPRGSGGAPFSVESRKAAYAHGKQARTAE
jgi:putative tryptophan/tyrosine transport system substrate-binding protein